MKTILLLGLLAFMFNISRTFAGNDGWTQYKSVDGVQIYSKVIPCTISSDPAIKNSNQEIMIFKFVNTTAKEVSVDWVFDVWYGNNCRTCGLKANQKKDYTHNLKLKANQTIEGTCSDKLDSGLMLLSGVQNKENQKKLTKFEMNNLIVSVLKK